MDKLQSVLIIASMLSLLLSCGAEHIAQIPAVEDEKHQPTLLALPNTEKFTAPVKGDEGKSEMVPHFALLLEADPGRTLGGSCLNDVQNMASHLMKRASFLAENIYVLTTSKVERQLDGVNYFDSRDLTEVIAKIASLMPSSNPEGKLIVLIAGHGFRLLDKNGDEEDGFDECIDIGSRIVTDDELHGEIFNRFKGQLLLLGDTCHSGTLFDLPHTFHDSNEELSTLLKAGHNKLGRAISISASLDSQRASNDLGEDTGFGGSLTTAVLRPGVLENLVQGKTFEAYANIRGYLSLLGQNSLLSSSEPF